MKRTTVYADEDDLAVLKAASARRGIAEAELIRDAIHMEAMANRSWDEPFFSQTYASEQEPQLRADDVMDDVMDDVWSEKAAAYEQTKNRRR